MRIATYPRLLFSSSSEDPGFSPPVPPFGLLCDRDLSALDHRTRNNAIGCVVTMKRKLIVFLISSLLTCLQPVVGKAVSGPSDGQRISRRWVENKLEASSYGIRMINTWGGMKKPIKNKGTFVS
jgi:hypothetical protein